MFSKYGDMGTELEVRGQVPEVTEVTMRIRPQSALKAHGNAEKTAKPGLYYIVQSPRHSHRHSGREWLAGGAPGEVPPSLVQMTGSKIVPLDVGLRWSLKRSANRRGLSANNRCLARMSSKGSVAVVQTTEPVACSAPSNGSTLLRCWSSGGASSEGPERIVVCGHYVITFGVFHCWNKRRALAEAALYTHGDVGNVGKAHGTLLKMFITRGTHMGQAHKAKPRWCSLH